MNKRNDVSQSLFFITGDTPTVSTTHKHHKHTKSAKKHANANNFNNTDVRWLISRGGRSDVNDPNIKYDPFSRKIKLGKSRSGLNRIRLTLHTPSHQNTLPTMNVLDSFGFLQLEVVNYLAEPCYLILLI